MATLGIYNQGIKLIIFSELITMNITITVRELGGKW